MKDCSILIFYDLSNIMDWMTSTYILHFIIAYLMNNCWNWSKDVFLELGFYNGNHFRGNSGPHMRWIVVSTRSCFETLTTLLNFRSTRIQLGPDWTVPVNSITSTMMKVYPLLSTSFCCPVLASLSTIWYVTHHHRVDAGLAVGVQTDRWAKVRH